MGQIKYDERVERWGVYEVSCSGPTDRNPFVDYQIQGVFSGKNESVHVNGFYDGEGFYKMRFMPSFEGEYTFGIQSNFFEGYQEGEFYVQPATEGNHGPVRVANTFHFAYEDGTPYYSIGTTCYVWNLQSDERIAETLETLKDSAFNKIRFCVFPKHYDYNLSEPRSYPYEGTPMDSSILTRDNFYQYSGNAEGNDWDFERFHTEHFRHIEYCIVALQKLGIEADLIVMHPYDRWGFSCMTKEQDHLYWNYVVNRFSAYRNVWWSLANEYDLLSEKTIADWEGYADIICKNDPYHHLRSIHNCMTMYDHSRPWITHCSIQRQDIYKTAELVQDIRERYQKPVVMDEMVYEGNIQHSWGNISGEEMLRRFWESVCRGGYPGHGETYMHPEDVLWWSHGGRLHGESHKRFEFLYAIMQETPGIGLTLHNAYWGEVCGVPEESVSKWKPVKEYYLFYYSFMQPSYKEYHFDDETSFQVNVIDTWEMTIEDRGIVKGKFRVDLQGSRIWLCRLRRCRCDMPFSRTISCI